MTQEPDVDYSAAWQDLRRRDGSIVFCLFIGVPLFIAAVNTVGSLAEYVGLSCLALIFVVATKRALFPCPRCKKKFFMLVSWGGTNPYRTTCPHCGLRKGSIDGT